MSTAELRLDDPLSVFFDEVAGRVARCERWWGEIEAVYGEHRRLAGLQQRGHSTANERVRTQGFVEDVTEAFLFQAARLSLLLFPVGRGRTAERRLERGRLLRELLGVNSLPALENRSLRDAFMHMDERLDAAVASHGGTTARYYFETRKNPLVPDDRIVRAFNTETLCVRILGEEFRLRPIHEDVTIVRAGLESVVTIDD